MRHEGAYLGRFRQGQKLPLAVQVFHSGAPARPDSAPTSYIYGSSGLITSLLLPVQDPSGITGVFSRLLLIDQSLPLGRYRVAYRWTVGGVAGASLDCFEVVGGGDVAGSIISMFAYDRPEARYVLAQVSAGRLVQGRNPRT